MARQAGFAGALVLSGVTRREHLAGLGRPPDLVIANLELRILSGEDLHCVHRSVCIVFEADFGLAEHTG